MGDINELMLKISIWTLPVLLSITLHELGHAWASNKLGDPTARLLGRVSLNPIRHIDPVGTILVPLVLLLIGGFVFGWAKPVPVDTRNLAEPRRDMALIALAGPLANLLMALGWVGVYWLSQSLLASGHSWAGVPLQMMARVGIILNIVLAVFNMLPLPPLDGSALVAWVLPERYAAGYLQIAPYGLFLLLGLVATGLLGRIVNPPIQSLLGVFSALLGLRL
jgi:Zn-dependent protease